MFFDLARYPFLPRLAERLEDFQAEARGVAQGYEYLKFRYGLFSDRQPGYLEGSRASFCWRVYGRPLLRNCEVCPVTSAVVNEVVPDLVTSGFYLLGPHSAILPHTGVSSDLRRGHMGIFCPADCALRVSDEVRSWSEGGFLVFDDTYEHEVWNRSDELRVILLFDFVREDMPAAERESLQAGLRRQLLTGADYAVLLQAGLEVDAEERARAGPPVAPTAAQRPEVIAEFGLYFL